MVFSKRVGICQLRLLDVTLESPVLSVAQCKQLRNTMRTGHTTCLAEHPKPQNDELLPPIISVSDEVTCLTPLAIAQVYFI